MILPKTKWHHGELTHTQSTVKYSYQPESFFMITFVLLTVSDIGRLSDNILKTERVVSLKIILHDVSFISDRFILTFLKASNSF